MNWIKCIEKMPHHWEEVLCFLHVGWTYEDVIISGCYDKYNNDWRVPGLSEESELLAHFSVKYYGQYYPCYVLAWMPLPEPPQE